jgi:hypothetical protein
VRQAGPAPAGSTAEDSLWSRRFQMTTQRKLVLAWLGVAALSLATAACHSDASANPRSEMTAKQAKASIGEVAVGHQLGANGQIAGDQKGNNFTAGQPVMISCEIGHAPSGTLVRIDWIGPNNVPLGSDEKTIFKGQTYSGFTKDTTGWKKGDYSVDVLIGGIKVDTERFAVVDASDTAAAQP